MRTGSPTSGPIPNWLGRFWMWLLRWEIVGQVPAGGKFVLIGAPHTSNWDFPFTLAAAAVLRLRISWMGKDSLFRRPLGGVMRWLGGIPVDRDTKRGLVDQVAAKFHESEELIVAIAPCGTRKKGDYWRTGFYWIARAAQVPILCGFLDYARRRAGVGLSFVPTGDTVHDLDRIRAFYRDIHGRKPELACTIRFLDNDARRGQRGNDGRPSPSKTTND